MSHSLPADSHAVNEDSLKTQKKSAESGNTPKTAPESVCNTDSRLHKPVVSAHCDWLSVSIPCSVSTRESVRADLEEFLTAYTDEIFLTEIKFFTGGFQGIKSLNGITIKWAGEESIISQNFIFLTIPGSVCGSLSVELFSGICGGLKSLNAKCTRIDFATTVLNPGISLEEITEQYRRGNRCTKSRNFRTDISYLNSGICTGYTLYIGNRKSETFIRIYDKGLEAKTHPHNEKIRFEVELHGQLANEAFRGFCESGNGGAANYAKSAFLTRLDFRDVESARGGRTNYAERQSWYAVLFDTGVCRWNLEPIRQTFLRCRNWLFDSVSAMLAMVYEGVGESKADEFITQLLRKGEEKMGARHYGILRNFEQTRVFSDG